MGARGAWLLLALAAVACGEDEPENDSCELGWSFTAPTVPSCDEIKGRIVEVAIERWRDELSGEPADAYFVSQRDCGEQADGSIDAPFCWLDEAIEAASHLDHGSVYLDPGEYSIMGETACSDDPDSDLTLSILGAGAAGTRLHLTCTPAAGSWSLSDLTLAADSVQVPAGRKLVLERVAEENLSGGSFFDVQGELWLTDVMVQLEQVTGGEGVAEGESAYRVATVTGSAYEDDVAVRLSDGARGVADGLCVEEAQVAGLLVTGAGTQLTLRDSVVRHTVYGPEQHALAVGVAVEDGANLTADGLLLEHNYTLGLLASDGAAVALERSVVRATQVGDYATGIGLLAQLDAELSVIDSSLVDNEGPGILVTAGGATTATGCEFDSNAFAAVAVLGGSLDVSDSRLASTSPCPSEGGGVGVFGHDLDAAHPVQLSVRDCVVEDNTEAVYLRAHSERSSGTLQGCCFGESTVPQYGQTVEIHSGSEAIVMAENLLEGSFQLLLHEGTVDLEGNTFTPPGEDGLTVKQQECDGVPLVDVSLESLPDPDGLELCEGYNAYASELDYSMFLAEVGVEGR